MELRLNVKVPITEIPAGIENELKSEIQREIAKAIANSNHIDKRCAFDEVTAGYKIHSYSTHVFSEKQLREYVETEISKRDQSALFGHLKTFDSELKLVERLKEAEESLLFLQRNSNQIEIASMIERTVSSHFEKYPTVIKGV